MSLPGWLAPTGHCGGRRYRRIRWYRQRLLLTLGERENRYCFTFQICLPEKDTPEGFSYYVNRAVRQAQEISLSEDSIVLPEETQGIAPLLETRVG